MLPVYWREKEQEEEEEEEKEKGGGQRTNGFVFSATNKTSTRLHFVYGVSCSTAVIDAVAAMIDAKFAQHTTIRSYACRSQNVRSLIGPPFAGQKVHRWTYLSPSPSTPPPSCHPVSHSAVRSSWNDVSNSRRGDFL